MKLSIRMLSLMLCLVLVVTTIPAGAFSEEILPGDGQVLTTPAPADEGPTAEATVEPTTEPTIEPTAEPTVEPTAEPTVEPTAEPTVEPTAEPTVEPTAEPTVEPTVEPTAEPTAEPTVEPTAEPTAEPTVEPTAEPTVEPTAEPTVEPTAEPTAEPTVEPTAEPTIEPAADKEAVALTITNADELRSGARTFQYTTVSVRLQKQGSGEALAGQTVLFYVNGTQQWTMTLDESGTNKVNYTFEEPGEYSIRVVFEGTDALESAEDTLTVPVEAVKLTEQSSDYCLSAATVVQGEAQQLVVPALYMENGSTFDEFRMDVVLGYSINGGETQYAAITAGRLFANFRVSLPTDKAGIYTIQSLKNAQGASVSYNAALPAAPLTYEVVRPELTVSAQETVYAHEETEIQVTYIRNTEVSVQIDDAAPVQITTNAEGTATLKHSFAAAGEHKITAACADGSRGETMLSVQPLVLSLSLGGEETIAAKMLDSVTLTGKAILEKTNAPLAHLPVTVTLQANAADASCTAEAVTDENGVYSVTFPAGSLSAGAYLLHAGLGEGVTGYDVRFSAAPGLNISKVMRPLEISLPEGALYIGDRLTVTVSAALSPEDSAAYPDAPAFTGTAALQVLSQDGTVIRTDSVQFENNMATFVIDSLPTAAAQLQCTADSDALYAAGTAQKTITVQKKTAQPSLSISETETAVYKKITAALTVTDQNGNALSGDALNALPLTLEALYVDDARDTLYQGTYGAFVEGGSVISFNWAGRATVTATLGDSEFLSGGTSAPSQQVNVDLAMPVLSLRGTPAPQYVGEIGQVIYLNWDIPKRESDIGGSYLTVTGAGKDNYHVNLDKTQEGVGRFGTGRIYEAGDYPFTVYYPGLAGVFYPAMVEFSIHVYEALLEMSDVRGMGMTYAPNETPVLRVAVSAKGAAYSGLLHVCVTRAADGETVMEKEVSVKDGVLETTLFGGEMGAYTVALTSIDANYNADAAYTYQVGKHTQETAGVQILPKAITWRSGSCGEATIFAYYMDTDGRMIGFGGDAAEITLLQKTDSGWETAETRSVILSGSNREAEAGRYALVTEPLQGGHYMLRVTVPETALHETLTGTLEIRPSVAPVIEIDQPDPNNAYYSLDHDFAVNGTVYGEHGALSAWATLDDRRVELPVSVDEAGRFSATANLPALGDWTVHIRSEATDTAQAAEAAASRTVSPIRITSYTAQISGDARVATTIRILFQLKDEFGQPVVGVTLNAPEVVGDNGSSYPTFDYFTRDDGIVNLRIDDDFISQWYTVTYTIDTEKTKNAEDKGRYVNVYPDGADCLTYRFFLDGKKAALTLNGTLPSVELDNDNASLTASFFFMSDEKAVRADGTVRVHLLSNGMETIVDAVWDKTTKSYNATLTEGFHAGPATVWASKDIVNQYESCVSEKYQINITSKTAEEPAVIWTVPPVIFKSSDARIAMRTVNFAAAWWSASASPVTVAVDGETVGAWSVDEASGTVHLPVGSLAAGTHTVELTYQDNGKAYSFAYQISVQKRSFEDRQVVRENGKYYLVGTLDVAPDQETTELTMDVYDDADTPTTIRTQADRNGRVRAELPDKFGPHTIKNYRVGSEALEIAFHVSKDTYTCIRDTLLMISAPQSVELNGGPVVVRVLLEGKISPRGRAVEVTIRETGDAAVSDACTVVESAAEEGVYLATLPEKYWKVGTYELKVLLVGTDEYEALRLLTPSFKVLAQTTRMAVALNEKVPIAPNEAFELPVAVLATERTVEEGTVTVTLTHASGGTTVTYENEPVQGGYARVDVSGLEAGSWKVDAAYSGTEQFAPSQLTAAYYVNIRAIKQQLNVEWQYVPATDGVAAHVAVQVRGADGEPAQGAQATVYFSRTGNGNWNNTVEAVTDGSGACIAAIPESGGVWYVRIEVAESDSWQAYTGTVGRFACDKAYTPSLTGSVTPEDGLKVGDTAAFTVSLANAGSAPADILVYVQYNNGEEKAIPVTQSEDKLIVTGSLTFEKGGTAKLIARYPGSSDATACQWTKTLSVAKKPTSMTISDPNWGTGNFSLLAYSAFRQSISLRADGNSLPFARVTISGMDRENGAYYTDKWGTLNFAHSFKDIPSEQEYKDFTLKFRYDGTDVYDAAEIQVTFRVYQAFASVEQNGDFDAKAVQPNSQTFFPAKVTLNHGGPSLSVIKQINYVITRFGDTAVQEVARGSVPVADDQTLSAPLVTDKSGSYQIKFFLPEGVPGFVGGEGSFSAHFYTVVWDSLTPQLTMLVNDAEISDENPATPNKRVKLRFTLSKDGTPSTVNGKMYVTVNGVRYEAVAAGKTYEAALDALPANAEGYAISIALESDTQKLAEGFEAPRLIVLPVQTKLTAAIDSLGAALKAGRTFAVSGKLTDDGDAPLTNAKVTLSASDADGNVVSLAQAQTDDAGEYRASAALPAGVWTVTAVFASENANYAGSEAHIEQVTVSPIATEIVSAVLQNVPTVSSAAAKYQLRVVEKGTQTPLTGAVVQAVMTIVGKDNTISGETDKDGYVTITLPASLKQGKYTAAFSVAADAYHLASETVEREFTVAAKTMLSIAGQQETAYTHMQLTYALLLKDELGNPMAGQQITYRLNGGNGTEQGQTAVTDDKGQATIAFRADTIGEFTLICSFPGTADGVYYASSATLLESLLPMPARLREGYAYSPESPRRGNALSLSAVLEDICGSVTGYTALSAAIRRVENGIGEAVDEAAVSRQVSLSDTGAFTLDQLPTGKTGTYRITLTADAQDGYAAVQETLLYTVAPQNTAAQIVAESASFTVRDQAQVTVLVQEDTESKAAVSGMQVRLTVLKKNETESYYDCGSTGTDSEGISSFTLPALPAGTYTLKAEIIGNEDYNGTGASLDVSSLLVETTLMDVQVPAQMKALGSYTISGRVAEAATGTPVTTGTVALSGMGETVFVGVGRDGNFSVQMQAVLGTKQISIAYLPGDIFGGASRNADVVVSKADATAELAALSTNADDDVQVKVTVRTQEGARVPGTKVSITLSGPNKNHLFQSDEWITDANGECTMTLDGIDKYYEGMPFDVTLSTTETASVNAADVTLQGGLSLQKGSTALSIGTAQETLTVGKPIMLSGTLKANKYLSGTVRVYAQYADEAALQVLTENAALDENRQFTVSFTPARAGRVKVTAEYAGSNVSNASSGSCELVIGQLATDMTLRVAPENRYAHLETQMQLLLKDGEGHALSGAEIKLYQRKDAEETQTLLSTLTTDENGAASFSHTFPEAGEYAITAVYAGSLNYSQAQKAETLQVLEMPLVVTGGWSAKACVYGDSYSFVGTLLDNAKQVPKITALNAVIIRNGEMVQRVSAAVSSEGGIALAMPTDKAGTYRLTLSLPAQNGYGALNYSADYTVLRRDMALTTSLSAHEITTLENGIVSCTAVSALGAAAGVAVQVTANNKTYEAVTDENGMCTVTLDRLPAGEYPVAIAAAAADERYNAAGDSLQLTVRKTIATLTLNAPAEKLLSNKGFTVSGTVLDEYGNRLTGKVDMEAFGKTFTLDAADGAFSCAFPPQAATAGASDSITASFRGGDIYTDGTATLQVTIYPVYTLRFESNGGTRLDEITAEGGTQIDLAAFRPARPGYAFQGWYADAEKRTQIASVALTADTTVYAGWKRIGPEDVEKENPYYDEIQFVYKNKLMDLTAANRFGVDGTVNRALLAETLWRLAKKPAAARALLCPDVAADASYADAAAWSLETGWMQADQNGLFNPYMQVDRLLLVQTLYAYAAVMKLDLTVEGDLNAWLAAWTDSEALIEQARKLAVQEAQKTETDASAQEAQIEERTQALCEAYRWAAVHALVETDGDTLNAATAVTREQLAQVCCVLYQMLEEQANNQK